MTPVRGFRLPPGALLASAVGVGVLAVALMPVEVAGTIDVPGRIVPAQEWTVVRGTDGAVSATLRDHRSGHVEATFAAAPERGDATHFRLEAPAGRVEAGDIVGSVVSGEAAVRASRLAGDIASAEAEVEVYRSGQKEPLVEASRQEVARAEATRQQAEREAARLRDLFSRDVVSAREVEAAEAEVETAAAASAAASARLSAARTGRRDEEVRLAQARRAALEREAAALEDRMRMNTLVSPISGTVHHVVSPDTLLLVADASSYTVVFPVRWSDRDQIRTGQTVRIQASEWGEPARARVTALRETPAQADGQTYLLASAEVTSGTATLTPGLLVLCSIETDPMPLTTRIRRFLAEGSAL